MADAPKEDDKPAATSADTTASTRQRMGVRLAPVDNSDQPVLANYATVNVAPGMAFIDFGFLEPGLLAAIPHVAKHGGTIAAVGHRQARSTGGDGVRRSCGAASAVGHLLARLRSSADTGAGKQMRRLMRIRRTERH